MNYLYHFFFYLVCNKSLQLIVNKECFDLALMWAITMQSFLQGPLPVANYTHIIIPGSSWTCPPSTKNTRMASSSTPPHSLLIELANARALPRPFNGTLTDDSLTVTIVKVARRGPTLNKMEWIYT